MKNLSIYLSLIFIFQLSSCQNEEVDVNSYPDEQWFESYRKLMVDENYTIELLRKGSLNIEDLEIIESKGLHDKRLISEYSKYISQEEFQQFLEFNDKLERLFQNVEFRELDLKRIEEINTWSIQQYSTIFLANSAFRISKDCEKEAGSAAGITFLGGLGAVGTAAAASAPIGGAAAVPALIGNIATSLIVYAATLKSCKNKEKEKENG